jgi:hypothetical protein
MNSLLPNREYAPDSIKGRKLSGAIGYYGCHCGEPKRGHLLTSFDHSGMPNHDSIEVIDGRSYCESVLLTADGAIFGWWGLPPVPECIVLVREVGRVRCTCYCEFCEFHKLEWGGRDHLFFDWRFKWPLPEVIDG